MPQTNDSTSLCECGCGLPAPISPYTYEPKGYIKGHPRRFRKGHHGRKQTTYRIEDCGYSSPCWVWQLGKFSNGYGRKLVGGRQLLAHRWHYEQEFGPIPEKLTLDHLCRNRACVNPQHMEAVTRGENVRRGMKPNMVASRTNTCLRGHALAGKNVITERNGKRRCRICRNANQWERKRARRQQKSALLS